jgi:hypothetical protein
MDHDDQDPLAGIEIFFPQLSALNIPNKSELLVALAFRTYPFKKIYGTVAVGAW